MIRKQNQNFQLSSASSLVRVCIGYCRSTVVILILLFSHALMAKVFDASKAGSAAYVRGSYAFGLDNTTYSKSQGSNSDVDYTTPYYLSGEFGGIYSTRFVNIRIGLEIIRAPQIDTDGVYKSTLVKKYSLTSNLAVLIPKIGFEMNIKRWQRARLQMGGSVGYANLSARNSYVFTSSGTSTYNLSDFAEELSATTMDYEGFLGFETLLADSTTVLLEGGYRSITFSEMTYSKDVTNFKGSQTKDKPALNSDGNKRTLDLSQAYVGLSFRFWFY